MPPDANERRPRQESGVQEDGGQHVRAIVPRATVSRRSPLRKLPHGRWMGGILYDPPNPAPVVTLIETLIETTCPGEFGADGRLRDHCAECR